LPDHDRISERVSPGRPSPCIYERWIGQALVLLVLVVLLLLELSWGHVCVVDVLVFERVGEGVALVAANAWVAPRPPTRALAAIDTAIPVCFRFITIFLSHLPSVAGSVTSYDCDLLVVIWE
jgi:hypothetical protein